MPNETMQLVPFSDSLSDTIRQELLSRLDELSNLEKEQIAIGTSIPSLYASIAKFVANPSTVSVETYSRMIDTDETIGSGIDFMNLALIARWGIYKHPNPEIEKFVRRAIDQMDGSWHTNLEEMLSAEWAGFSATEMVWKMDDDFDGAPAFVPKKLVTYPPLTMVFAVDQAGEVLPDGIYQYQRFQNQWMQGAFRQGSQRRGGDLDGFRPDLFASTGDYPYAVRVAADISYLTVMIPRDKILHLTSTSTGKFRNPYGRSILRRVYKSWVAKDAFLKMWLVAADRKGTPLIVGYAPANDTVLNQIGGIDSPQGAGAIRADQALANTLSTIHNSSFIVIPGKKADGFEIDSVQVQGDMNVFVQGVEYYNKAILRGLLIPPLVMGSGDGVGSYALGDAHKDVFTQTCDGKAKVYKQAVLNQFIRKIIAYNFPIKTWEKDGVGDFVVEDYDPDVLGKLADTFDKLTSTGFMSPDMQEDLDHVRTKFGLASKKVEAEQPSPDGSAQDQGLDVKSMIDDLENKAKGDPDKVAKAIDELKSKAQGSEENDLPKFDF